MISTDGPPPPRAGLGRLCEQYSQASNPGASLEKEKLHCVEYAPAVRSLNRALFLEMPLGPAVIRLPGVSTIANSRLGICKHPSEQWDPGAMSHDDRGKQ